MTRADWELAFPLCERCAERPPLRWRKVFVQRFMNMGRAWAWECPVCRGQESGESVVARRARALAEPVGSVAA
jgi:hypothetical protein